MGDIKKYGDKGAVTSLGLLAHGLYEQSLKQKSGQNDYKTHHKAAVTAESGVTGFIRLYEDGSNYKAKLIGKSRVPWSGYVDLTHMFKDNSRSTMMISATRIHVEKGSVLKVEKSSITIPYNILHHTLLYGI